MEVVFGEADAIVAVRVEILGLFRQVAQHALVEVCPPTSHAGLQLALTANRGKIENTEFHNSLLTVNVCPWGSLRSGGKK